MGNIYGTKKISKLKRIDEAQGSDLLSVSAKTDDAYESVRMSVDTITDATMSYEYDGLNTDAKTIVGAINEAKAEHTSVVVEQLVSTGEHIADISVGEETTEIYSQTIQANVDSEPVSQLNKIKIDNTVYSIPTTETVIYGFHIDSSESDPSACVTYLMDSVNKTPAHMNYSTDTFDYGDWADTFIIKGIKPCILNPQGQVVCYLNPNDYTKDIDGNTVPITQAEMDADSTSPYYHCNIMIEFPKIWLKVVPDSNDVTSGSVYISNVKADDGFKDFAYISSTNNYEHKEHFYFPAYNGSIYTEDSVTYIRSVSNAQYGSGYSATDQRTYCSNNGSGYHMNTLSECNLIFYLCWLISKSLDLQTSFGQGLSSGGTEEINADFRTGVQNLKGLFYGTNSGTASTYTNAVKVFGIENFWGFAFRRYLGHIYNNKKQYIKLCFGTEDGSTSNTYNDTGTGYIRTEYTPLTEGYIKNCTFTNNAILAYQTGSPSSSSTCYCDYMYSQSSSNAYFACQGGNSRTGSYNGFCIDLIAGSTSTTWYLVASPSYC